MIRSTLRGLLSLVAASGLVLCWLAIVAGMAIVMVAGYGIQRLDK